MPGPDGSGRRRSFYETITAAVADVAAHGYDGEARIRFWMDQIQRAAEADMVPEHVMRSSLNASIGAIYERLVNKGELTKRHPGISRFTLERIKPRLRNELDRRIMASANLIKLNRRAAIEKTLQRFSGWSTSIAPGGSKAVDKNEVKDNVRKSMAALPFEERRVLIDQGHKFTSELNNIVAVDGGALAAVWHSHFRQPGYDYREDHKERDGVVYAVRGNWAMAKGLMKRGPNGYTDEITKPAEEVFCRCWYTYLYSLRGLPPDMLTVAGAKELERVRVS